MTIRPIVALPDPVLRRKARPVTRFDADLQTLVDDMIDTMREAPGVG
ncbi:MAG TPA: peptide deformylase, partial [Anaerolineales bacterium]|nr:peptide deformylase [Anaerolineales bacterium]